MKFAPLYENNLPEGIDSLQEVYFEWWLSELVELGYIKSFKRSTRYKLIDNVFHNKLDFNPTKKEPLRYLIVQREFLKSWTYEPDYDIVWTEKSFNKLFQDINFLNRKDFKTLFYADYIDSEWISIIDVKPQVFRGGNMSSSVKFPLIQKMMYNKYNIYIHKISPLGSKGLFDNSFTPMRYLLQDKQARNRKISKWIPISITQYLKENDF